MLPLHLVQLSVPHLGSSLAFGHVVATQTADCCHDRRTDEEQAKGDKAVHRLLSVRTERLVFILTFILTTYSLRL